MCGIAGHLLRGRSASEDLVRAMCGRIRHRGPDDEGYFLDGPCALGMRRLSIIDLSTGHQPMGNEDGSIQTVFNGEIYNYPEVRQTLRAAGHSFRTASDTETIVHAYEQWGTGCFARLRGMFAVALWDGVKRQLVLARDRFGKKPLYYAASGDGLYFGSELKTLLEAGVSREIDREALRLYFRLGYIPDPRSPYASVRKLEAGTWLVAGEDGTRREGRYWNQPVPDGGPAKPGMEADLQPRLRAKLDEAVRVRLMSEVPLGAFLSGGLDSSIVVASMAAQSREPVRTFSIGFDEPEFNELGYARQLAAHCRTEHRDLIVRPDAVSLAGKLATSFDEPFGDSSAIPAYLISEFAAAHVKVVLTGDGGDELFGGYERFYRAGQYRGVPRALRLAAGLAAKALPYAAYGKSWLRLVSQESFLTRYLERNFAPHALLERLYLPDWAPPGDAEYLEQHLGPLLPADAAPDEVQAIYWETHVNLAGDLLVKVDRMTMAHSIEARCPLLDHELAELAFSIPNALKWRNGRGKWILEQTFADRLPATLLGRKKQGFAVPLARWMRGELKELVRDTLTGPRIREAGFVSPEFLETLIAEHESCRRDQHHWLWSLLMLEMWRRPDR